MPTKKTRGQTFHPRTKAEWLQEQFFPDHPTFPLDAEIVAAIPEGLPGDVPSNATELYADEPAPSTRAPRRPRRPRKTTKARRRRRCVMWVYDTTTQTWHRRALTTPPAYPHIRLLPPPDPADCYRYPGMDEQKVFNVQFVERMEWLESLDLDPFTGARLRLVKK